MYGCFMYVHIYIFICSKFAYLHSHTRSQSDGTESCCKTSLNDANHLSLWLINEQITQPRIFGKGVGLYVFRKYAEGGNGVVLAGQT